MSSVYVRDEIKGFLDTNFPDETVVDLTADYQNINDLLKDNGIDKRTPWIGLQFVGDDETPITITSGNSTGKYRELGAVYIHIVSSTKPCVSDNILPRAENIRNAFRGQRINDVVIQSMTPPNFGTGATLNFEGGWTSASVILSYERDLDL